MSGLPWRGIAERLQVLDFAKRGGVIFTRDVSPDVIGWLGLNRASRHTPPGEFEVNPVVGIRHQGVERVVAELRGKPFHAYLPPTVSSPLGYLMPEARYRPWMVGSGPESADIIADMVAAIAEYGVPFMESNASLPRLCRLLDDRLGLELVYRPAVAWLLAGEVDRAAALIEEAEAGLGDRADAAAVEVRDFVAAFRCRHLRASER
jgi:hypothetical protein